MYHDTFMEGARKSTRLLWASRGSGGGGAVPTRRQADMEPSTFSRATSALRRGVTICLVRSGPSPTDYHIDFTGSTTGTADSSSGSAQLIIWRTRRHQAEDNATIRRHRRRTPRGCAMRGHGCGGAMSTTMPPGETGCSGVALGFSSDYLQGRPRGYLGNGHIQWSFQYAVGDHKYAVEIHRSYR